jgi:hypothetical protein
LHDAEVEGELDDDRAATPRFPLHRIEDPETPTNLIVIKSAVVEDDVALVMKTGVLGSFRASLRQLNPRQLEHRDPDRLREFLVRSSGTVKAIGCVEVAPVAGLVLTPSFLLVDPVAFGWDLEANR